LYRYASFQLLISFGKYSQVLLVGTLAIVLVGGFGAPAFAQETLYLVHAPGDNDPNLYVIDASNGNQISSIPVTLSGQTIDGFSGLATNSFGQLFALVKVSSQPERLLVLINPTTGVATLKGDTGDLFTNLAFDASDTLFTNSSPGGNAINVPSHFLFTLNTNTGMPTSVCDLPFAGQFGSSLGFNPASNSLFYTEGDSPAIFHELTNIAVDPCGFTNIPLTSSSGIGDFNALTWSPANGAFYLATGVGGDQLWNLPSNGQNSFIASLGAISTSRNTGLALVHEMGVGGELLPIDNTALLLAGIQSSAIWMLPAIAGAAGAGAYIIKTRLNKE